MASPKVRHVRSLLASISVAAAALFGAGCSDDADTGLSTADVEAITRAISADGRMVVFGVQRTSETEVTAWATPRAAEGNSTQPAADSTEFVLTKSPQGWRIVRQRQVSPPAEQ